jgi:hypothetical protein
VAELPTFLQRIVVETFRLPCVGCTSTFPATARPDPMVSEQNLNLTQVRRSSDGFGELPVFRPIGEHETPFRDAANTAGWRQVNVYGQTVYVCPECRKKRLRPEWEQRL